MDLLKKLLHTIMSYRRTAIRFLPEILENETKGRSNMIRFICVLPLLSVLYNHFFINWLVSLLSFKLRFRAYPVGTIRVWQNTSAPLSFFYITPETSKKDLSAFKNKMISAVSLQAVVLCRFPANQTPRNVTLFPKLSSVSL